MDSRDTSSTLISKQNQTEEDIKTFNQSEKSSIITQNFNSYDNSIGPTGPSAVIKTIQ